MNKLISPNPIEPGNQETANVLVDLTSEKEQPVEMDTSGHDLPSEENPFKNVVDSVEKLRHSDLPRLEPLVQLENSSTCETSATNEVAPTLENGVDKVLTGLTAQSDCLAAVLDPYNNGLAEAVAQIDEGSGLTEAVVGNDEGSGLAGAVVRNDEGSGLAEALVCNDEGSGLAEAVTAAPNEDGLPEILAKRNGDVTTETSATCEGLLNAMNQLTVDAEDKLTTTEIKETQEFGQQIPSTSMVHDAEQMTTMGTTVSSFFSKAANDETGEGFQEILVNKVFADSSDALIDGDFQLSHNGSVPDTNQLLANSESILQIPPENFPSNSSADSEAAALASLLKTSSTPAILQNSNRADNPVSCQVENNAAPLIDMEMEHDGLNVCADLQSNANENAGIHQLVDGSKQLVVLSGPKDIEMTESVNAMVDNLVMEPRRSQSDDSNHNVSIVRQVTAFKRPFI